MLLSDTEMPEIILLISLYIYICLSVCNKSKTTEWIFMNFEFGKS
jgi:hypothetical protein